MRKILGVWFCLAAVLPAFVEAQEDDVPAGQPPAAVVEAPAERIIYLPFKRLEDVLDQQNSSVIIPYPEYLRLWTKAEGETPSAGVDIGAVITRVEYVATVEQELARISARLTIRVVGKPWVEVPLEFGDAAVGRVSSETGDVLLRGDGDGKYRLLLKEPGEQIVTLDLTTRVVTSPDGRQMQFTTPTVAVTDFELIIPQADQEVEVRPRLLQRPAEAAAGTTRITASLGATGQISATWHARASSKPQMELLASVTNRQRVSLGDGLVHTDASLEYTILRGELEQVRFVVPTGQRVLDVTASARISKWQTVQEENRQVVTVELLTPVADKLTVEAHAEAKLEADELSVAGVEESGTAHGIHALDVVRESGQLVVVHGSELTLRVIDQLGLVRIESDEVATEIRQRGALAFKFYSPQFRLQVAVAAVEPLVRLEQSVRIDVRDDQLRADADLTFTVERAGLFELRLSLPDGLEITRVDAEEMESYRVDEKTLVIALRQQMTGEIALKISGEQSLPADGEQFELPLLEPRGVDRERGLVQLFAPEAIELITNEDELESALPDSLGGVPAAGNLRASWRFTRRPVKIPVTIRRKPTRLSAQVATDVDVQPTRTRLTTTVDFLVEYAGQDTFRIEIPEAALPTLQIEAVGSDPTSPALREKTAGEPVDGWVIHTLTLQRPVTGHQRFRLTYDLQPQDIGPATDAGDAGAAPAIDEAAPQAGDAAAGGAVPADRTPGGTNDAARETDGTTDPGTTDPGATDGGTAAEKSTGSADQAALDQPFANGAEDAAAAAAAAADPSAQPAETEVMEAAAAGDESTAAALSEPDVSRQQSTIWIVRPLGIEEAAAIAATPLQVVTGEVRLAKEESLTITAEASGADIEPMDVRELRTLPAQGTLAFRYRQHPAEETISLTVTQARYDVREMIATVVSRAVVEIMLGHDAVATYRCRYRLQSTERQRLELRLPKGIELLSVLVNATDVRLEPAGDTGDPSWDRYFVNVSRSGESDEPFQLSLQYLLTFNQPPFDSGFMRGRVSAPLPIVGANDGSAALQELRAIVWVPEEFALIGDPNGFVLDGHTNLPVALLGGAKRKFLAQDDDGWIGRAAAAGLDFPTGGRVPYRYTNLGGQGVIKLLWWDTVKVSLVVSLALAVIALVLVRTDWENKLGILLLIAFGALLLGLKNMHVLAHALSAMRFGLLFMVGLWIIHAIFGPRIAVATALPPGSPPSDTPPSDGPPSGDIPSSGPGAGPSSARPPLAAAVPPPGVIEHFLSSKPTRDDELH